MLRMYLKRHDGSWSDAGYYDSTPEAREEGVWVVGEPPEKGSWEPIDLNKVLTKMVAEIPVKTVQAYAVNVLLAKTYLDNNNPESALVCIGDIWKDVGTSGIEEHINAIKPIIEFLVSIGVMEN